MALPITDTSLDISSVLQTLGEYVTVNRVLAGAGALFLLSNVKGFPGVWHVRLIRGLLTQLVFNSSRQPAPILDAQGRPRLFNYLITHNKNPIIECDYNLHKSNSTFFADLDINRTNLMTALFKHVLSKKSFPKSSGRKKPLGMALGGVSCIFHREISPLQSFEVWSRVLAWDEKWVYVVSYFVKRGAVKVGKGDVTEDPKPKYILASCLARYVFKNGRITVQPDEVLKECGLISSVETGDAEGVKESKESVVSPWDAGRFEEARTKGLEVAGKLTAMDVLPSFAGLPTAGSIGTYRDL